MMIEILENYFSDAFNLRSQRVVVPDRTLLAETNDLGENKDQSWTRTWTCCHQREKHHVHSCRVCEKIAIVV